MRPLSGIILVVALGAGAAQAQVCSARALNRDLQNFRRLSLVLRDRAPSAAELDAIVARGGLADADVEALLGSPEFAEVQRERLRHDLYGALDLDWEVGFQLLRTDPVSTPGLPDTRDVFWNRFREAPACDPSFEQSAYDGGVPVADRNGLTGWVKVEPYWAPGTKVKVCAIDAQAHLKGPFSGIECGTTAALVNPHRDCGCGPNLSFCQLGSPYAAGGVFYEPTFEVLNRAFAEQSLRFARRLVEEGRPWSALLNSAETEVNGPIAHYLRYQTGTNLTANLASRPDLGYPNPRQLSWPDARTWVRVQSRGKAAGVLTQPHFLLKFATNRARANKFYNSFLCSSFQAPPGGLPSPTEACARNPNLTQRCGCSSCHAALEPMAARWGRFAERGTHELPAAEFPSFDASCVADGGPVNQRCRDFYRTHAASQAEQPYVGQPKAFLFADGFEHHVDEGPLTLAQQAIASGAFARCTVSKEFQRVVGRPLREDLADERALRDALTTRFTGSNYDLRDLMRALVATPQFRTLGGAP